MGESGLGVYLDFRDAIKRLGEHGDQGALRQPVRHVRAHHRRRSLRGADAHLPGHPLHDGRPVGGLQPDDHHPGPVRARRGQLLRPRRQPPGRQRPDAGPGRRLFRPAHTPSATTSPPPSSKRSTPTTPPFARPKPTLRETTPSCLLESKATRSVDSFHRELGKIMWENCGMARTAAGPEDRRSRRFPRCARSSGTTSSVLGAGEELNQSLEKAGRVADFFELGRADVPATRWSATNPAAAISARSTRRPKAKPLRDDENSPTWRPGNSRARTSRRSCTRSRSTFEYVHPAQRSYK